MARHKATRDIRVDILSAGFGLGSWIAMTGLWVELPVLVQRLPEGWALASHLALYLQVANVGPILYGLFHHWWPRVVTERAATHFQLAIGAISTLLLIFLWSWTVNSMSIPFFVFSFGLSLVDCTSSVVFLPFMIEFKPCYLTPYLLGEGLSGFLPSLVAIAQGIENPECANETRIVFGNSSTVVTENVLVPMAKDPRFSPEWFFAFLLLIVLLSWLAFVLLDKLPLCQKEKICFIKSQLQDANVKTETTSMIELKSLTNKSLDNNTQSLGILKNGTMDSTRWTYFYLLFLQLWASIATFGIFPAIQPYSCLPYGDSPYHLTVTLCGLAYPAACMLAVFYELRSIRWISVITLVSTLISVYAMVTAVMSPQPPLLGTTIGSVLIVCCWVIFMFTFSYVKTMATVLLGAGWGHRALFWCGAVTQAGAVAGALLMFILVNVFNLFHDEGLCVA